MEGEEGPHRTGLSGSIEDVHRKHPAKTDAMVDVSEPRHQHTAVDEAFADVRPAPAPRNVKESTANLPDKIGRFTVLDVLGKGGMGVVYTAFDEELGRKVAVKLLHDRGRMANNRRNRRFLREAQAMAKLSHPNVVTIYEVGFHGAQVYLAMEYVRGVTLKRWMRSRQRPWKEVLNVCCAAGEGLSAAHDSGLVHRDFKPENVLLGRDGRVRVLDFGLARQVDAEHDIDSQDVEESVMPDVPRDFLADNITVPGAVVGTPAYMAPEQHMGEEADVRSDQFSFCVAMWEALYGERPFKGRTVAEIGEKVLAGELSVPPRDSAVPNWVRRVVTRGLSLDPDRRFPSVDALLQTLSDLNASSARQVAVVPLMETSSDPSSSMTGARGVIDRRYHMLSAGSGSMTSSLLRAYDRLKGTQVFLRELGDLPLASGDEVAIRQDVASQIQQLLGFRHPHVVGVEDFVIGDDMRGYAVLGLREDPTSILEVAQEVPLSIRMNHIVQLLHAADYILRHACERTLFTPETVAWADGSVKLIDVFGASTTLGGRIGRIGRPYVPPEWTERSRTSVQSLLFGIGTFGQVFLRESVVASEDEDVNVSVSWLASHRDDSLSSGEMRIDGLREVFDKMAAEAPEDRFESISQAAAALRAAVKRPFELEPLEMRESVLQAGGFVGRERELEFVRSLLQQTHEFTAGGMLLIGGESGVGKSRLKREIHGMALTSGYRVFEGQCVSNGGQPFHLWREVLRALLMVIEIEDEEAGVLASIVPDLELLMGKSVEHGVEFDATVKHARLVEVVDKLVRRVDRPVLILLEDLQWVRSESMTLLEAVQQSLMEVPVLVVATFRDDEMEDPEVRFPMANHIRLQRLGPEEIERFALGTLGVSTLNPRLVNYLGRESEGNPFFLVETMRALADQHDGLSHLPSLTEIQNTTAGGIRKTMRRRLAALASEDVQLLQIAALCGRAVDFDALEPFVGQGKGLEWAGRCEKAAVFSKVGDRWSFAHDKLREAVIEYMPEERRRAYHLQIAQALEARFKDTPAQAAVIAFHYARGKDDAKEVFFSAIGGEHALASGAHVEGAKLLERAVQGREQDAWDARRLSIWRRKLADVYLQIGDHENAQRHLRRLLKGYIRTRIPARVFSLLWGLGGQLFHRVVKKNSYRGKSERRRYLVDLSRGAATHSAICVYDNDFLGLMNSALLGANLGDRVGWVNLASYGMLGAFLGAVGMPRVAESYFTRARAVAVDASNARDAVMFGMAEVSFYMGRGKLARGGELARDGLQHARRLGDRRGCSIFEHQLAMIAMFEGRHQAMLAHALKGKEVLRDDGAVSSEMTLAMRTVGLSFWMQGRYAHGIRVMEEARDAVPQHEALSVAAFDSTLAKLAASNGETARAIQYADDALARWSNSTALTASNPQYLSGMLDAYLLGAHEAMARGEDAKVLTERCRRLLKYQAKWSRAYPVGASQGLYYQAKFYKLRGESELAIERARAAVDRARDDGVTLYESLGMALVVAWSYQEGERDVDALERTLGLLDRIGATGESTRLEQQCRSA